jgi:outer membrane autotransporter protein
MMLLHTAPHRVAVAAGRLRSLRSATGLGSAALFALAWGLVFFALVAPASGDEAVTGNPADPAGSSAATAPAPPAALLGQVSSAYGAVIPTTQFLGLDTLGTLYDRIGDETIGTNPGNADVHINAAWGRAFGGYVGAAYGGQAQTRTRDSEVGMQTGLDLYRHITAKGGRDVFGAYFSYASVEVETSGLVTNAAGTDSVMTMTGGNMVNAYSGGLYYTHFDPAGWYADLVGQGTHYSGIAGTGRTLIPLSGYGFATSLELGAPIACATAWRWCRRRS